MTRTTRRLALALAAAISPTLSLAKPAGEMRSSVPVPGADTTDSPPRFLAKTLARRFPMASSLKTVPVKAETSARQRSPTRTLTAPPT
jgi:hypothetical protein